MKQKTKDEQTNSDKSPLDLLVRRTIVFVEYDAAGKPFQVYVDDLTGFDFFYEKGLIRCEWCSSNIRPFISELVDAAKKKIARSIWFLKDFRPTNGSYENRHLLTNDEIESMGYAILKRPHYISEIYEAID